MAQSIKDIAQLAGVSTATVSRVFNKSGYVREEVAQRVLQIASEQGFQPKSYTRQPKSAHERLIGVMVPDICNTYYMDVIHGIEDVVDEKKINVFICNTDEDPKKEIRTLATLKDIGVDGVIVVPISSAEAYNADYLVEMNRRGTPVVLLDRDVKQAQIDGVFMDNFNSGYLSTKTLLENGHRHIAIICGPTSSTSGSDRLQGYLKALEEYQVPVREEYILYGDFKFDMAYRLTKELLAKHLPVTAIFSSNSRMSQGSLYALAESHIRVPEDMAFISCGRLDGNYERISTVQYPTRAIGSECARILLEKIVEGKRVRNAPKRRVTFDMQLTLRGSEVYPTGRKEAKA